MYIIEGAYTTGELIVRNEFTNKIYAGIYLSFADLYLVALVNKLGYLNDLNGKEIEKCTTNELKKFLKVSISGLLS
jgi:hypothetical protein